MSPTTQQSAAASPTARQSEEVDSERPTRPPPRSDERRSGVVRKKQTCRHPMVVVDLVEAGVGQIIHKRCCHCNWSYLEVSEPR